MAFLFASLLLFIVLIGLIRITELLIEVWYIIEKEKIYDKILSNNFFGKSFFILLIIAFLTIICFILGPYLIHESTCFEFLHNTNGNIQDTSFTLAEEQQKMKPNEIGDAFGGTVGPIIAFVASILTFFAFYVQFQANQQQKKDLEIERFESRYFEMIRLHKANTDELKISENINGRECFKWYIEELRLIYKLSEEYHIHNSTENIMEQTFFAYKIFWIGIDNIKGQNDFEINLIKFIKEKIDSLPKNGSDKNGKILTILLNTNKVGEGKIDYLGHYFRHLFLTVKYVVKSSPTFLTHKDKLNYLSMLRAQLSNCEQLLLYYNALGKPGIGWFKKEYHTKYKMIHNLPLALADFGLHPLKHPEIMKSMKYWESQGKKLFEWNE